MQQEYSLFSLNDFIGVPLVLVFLFLLIRWLAPLYIRDPKKLKLFYFGLFLRTIGVIASVLFYNYIQTVNDTYTYYTYGKTIAKVMSGSSFDDVVRILTQDYKDLSINLRAGFPSASTFADTYAGNRATIQSTALISFLTFDSYLAISIIFSVFGYFGCWLIFYKLAELYPALQKFFYFFVICWPSAFFFGSSLMKEPLCMGCLGVIFYLLFTKPSGLLSLMKMLILASPFVLMLMSIKSYLLWAMCTGFVIAYIWSRISRIPHLPIRRVTYLLLAAALIGPTIYFIVEAQSFLNAAAAQKILKTMTSLIKNQLMIGHSKYDLGEIELTSFGIVRYMLASLNVSLIRPYVFEITNLQLLISGSESLAMLLILLYTLYRVPFREILYSIKTQAILQFCLIFVIIIGIQIGAISFNFGTLVRYKMPLVPFYFTFFILLLHLRRKKIVIKTQ